MLTIQTSALSRGAPTRSTVEVSAFHMSVCCGEVKS
ncbi:hypothetical protein SEA_CECE_188 [Microbacterium phage Cece]|nr:hypothetical protein SEA_CECE_188 [Microbacterium phage Cece]